MEKEPMMTIVHDADKANNIEIVDVDRLKSLIERIECLQEEIKGIQSDVKDIFAEAKSCGFDVKIMRQIIKLRAMNAVDRDEQECLLETYRKALDI